MPTLLLIAAHSQVVELLTWRDILNHIAGNHPVHLVSVLCIAWEIVTIGQGASCLFGLIKLYNCSTSVVWEQQRGYLDHFLREPFVDFIRAASKVNWNLTPRNYLQDFLTH